MASLDTTDSAEEPPVKKARAPRKPKAPKAEEPLEEGEIAETEKKVKAPRKTKAEKQPVEKQIKLHGPETPDTPEKFFHILKSFIKQSSRYSALTEKPDGIIYPVFLKITGDFNEETGTFPCEFYNTSFTDDEETSNRVYKPVWTSVLEKGEITMNQCFNILPFDKNYNYDCLIPLKIPVEEPVE